MLVFNRIIFRVILSLALILVPVIFLFAQPDQTITFNSIDPKTYGDADFSLGATASSGLTVSYTSSNPSVATIIGSTVTIVGAGSAIITASQAGDGSYNAAPDVTQELIVNKATPAITWNTPTAITYGTALSATQLNATASVAGTFDYTPASGEILNAGSQILSVSFTPTDGSNYNNSPATVSLTVQQKQLIVTADNKTRVYNSPDPVFTLNYFGFTNGDGVGQLDALATATSTAVALSPVGSYPIIPTGGSDSNYFFTYVNGSLTIDKATPSILWNTPAAITYGTALNGIQLNANAGVSGSYSYSPIAGTILNAGTNQNLSVIFNPTDNSNYNSVNTAVQITVSQASLTITADNQAKIYNTANPSLTISYSGFVNGDTESVLNSIPSISTTALLGSVVGNYPITLTGGSDNNYTFLLTNGTLTVNKATPVVTWNNPSAITYGTALTVAQLNASANVGGSYIYSPLANTVLNAGTSQTLSVSFVPTDATNYNTVPLTSVLIAVNPAVLTVTANNQNKIYGEALPALTLTYAGFVNGDDASDLDVAPIASTVANSTSPVTTYPITASGGSDPNYTFNYISATLTVLKATPVISWNNPGNISYGTALSTAQLNASSNVSGSFSYSPVEGIILNAGNSQILNTSFTPDDVLNYNIVAGASVQINVTKAILNVTADSKVKVYGSENPSLTVSYSGFVNSETSSVLDALSTATTSANTTSPAGSYSVTPAGGSDNNYSYNYIAGILTINKVILTVTANNQSRSYGGTNPALTISYTGFVNAETSAVLDIAPIASTAAVATSAVGTFPIIVAGGSDGNYDFSYVNGTLTISKAILSATANNQSRLYGASNPIFTISYSGFVNGETITDINTAPTAATTATPVSVVGPYSITVSGGLDDNYDFSYVPGTLSIIKATLTATANDQSRTYGAANPTFTISYTGFVNSDTPSGIDTPPGATTSANGTTPVGAYTITAAGGVDNNYDFIYSPGTLTITKATVTARAVDVSRSYGAVNPVFAISYTGFLNGENFTVLDSTPTTSTIASLGSDVGAYPIVISGGSDNNYTILLTDGILTISKVTVTATASNASRVYNVANPTFTITYTGFVNGETFSVLDTAPAASTTATLSSSVGTYPISVNGGVDNNYSLTYISGTLTITKATPTVTWIDPSDIVYGTPLSATQLNATASIPGTFNYNQSIGAILNVLSNHVLSVNFNPTDGINYNAVNGTNVVLAVTKATLTATPNNQSRPYGAANPIFTIGYAGFVNGETVSVINVAPAASSSATTSSPVGTYSITASGASDNNYEIVYAPGILTITKTIVTAIAVDASRVYGSTNPVFSINYTGFVNGDDSNDLNTVPVASTTASPLSAVGTHPITVSGGVDDNYNFAYTSGTLTILKALLTATVSNASRIYGVANPSFSISYSGFVNGETVGVIDFAPTATSAANLLTSVGTYPITASGGLDNNYSFTYVNGTLTIIKATPVVSWSNPSAITYGTALSATQLNATANVAGTMNYTPALGLVLGAGSQTLRVDFTPTDATNYNSVSNTTVTLLINKATPVITWNTPAPITYGTALSAIQLNATANVAGTLTYTPASGTVLAAGSQTLRVDFTPTDGANYNSVSNTQVVLTVNKATPVVTWLNPLPITYGTPLSSTQLNATGSVPGTFVYAPGMGTILNAGSQVLSVNFTPTDATNFNPVNGTTVSITVNKATPVVTWASPSAITYGTPLSSTQLNASASVAGSFIYTPASGTVLSTGANQVLSVNFTPTDLINYNPVNPTTVVISVTKATPVITWPNPAAITYGTPLSATQLNATANVPGTFIYTPTLGTLLNAGINQVLSVDFTPTDAANYQAVNDVQRLITVNKATPVITWANPAPIIYGTPLTSTQLNASANVPGTFSYLPASGTILNVGVNQTLSLNFTPTDAINFNSVIGRTASITVNKATPVITWPTPVPIKVNEALTSTQLNATSSVPGTFTYTPSIGTSFSSPNTYTLSVAFNPTDGSNYNTVPSTQVQIVVNNKDNPVITWANPAAITYGTTLGSTQLNATASVPGTFVYTPALGALLNVGANQTLSVNFIPTDGINYNSVNRTVPLTVNKATLTATAVSTSRIYGAANPAFSITYAGFVNGETAGVIDTAPTASCSAIAGDNAGGVFPIVPAGGVDNNYMFNYVNGSLSINKAPLTARADDKSRSYGLANPGFTISYTGFVNGDTESEITTPAANTAANSLSNVGTYPITLSGGASFNYNLTLQHGTLTINVSPLIARASDNAKTYGQPNPTLTIAYSGFLNGDNASSITPPTINTTATSASAVGSYPITLSGGAAVNYGIILQPGTLTISKASLTVTANNQSRTYGATNPALTVSYSGFVNGDNSSMIDSPPVASTTATITSPVAAYSISVSGGSDNNYNLVYVSGSLSITKATLTASATSASRLYGAVNPGFIINYAGFLNGDELSIIDIVPTATSTAVTSSPVGTYSITPAGGTDNNYNFTYVPATLTVSKATLVATAQGASRPYGTANPTFVINYSGFVNGETTTVLDVVPTTSTVANVASNVGTYAITVSGGSDNNYLISNVNAVLTIIKATPSITWFSPAAIVFGTPLSATQLNATAGVAGTFTYTPGNGTVLNAGVNQLFVNFNPTDATNYNAVSGSSVSITVNKATPTVSWSTPASITYGTTLNSTQLNATASVAGTFTYNPPSGTTLNAGTNQVLSVDFTPTDAGNYNVVNGRTVQITVNKATPVVTWLVPAAISYGTPLGSTQLNASASVPGSFVYTPAAGSVLNAGPNQTLTVNFNPSDVNNYNSVNGTTTQITVNKATPIITWPAPAQIIFGTALSSTQLNATANTPGAFVYTPASGTILNVGSNQILSVNFTPTNTANFNSVTGTTVLISVVKSFPVITWSSPASISYGTPLSATQLNATSNVPGTFTYSPTMGEILNAGVNQTLSVDFTPTNTLDYGSVNGTTVLINVNKINLTATANDLSRTYGAANPALTINYSGFVNGEIETVLDGRPTVSTVATSSSPVGIYPMNVGGGVDNNYNFTYLSGSLTINKAPLTVTADNKTRLFGTPNPELTVSYSGFVNNDTALSLDVPPTVVTNAVTSSSVGGYPITVSGGNDNNYSFTYAAGTLNVTPNFPPVIKSFEIATKEDEQFNLSYTTFGDNFTSFSGSTIVFVKVISLPVNGVLFWKGAVVSVGTEITVTNGMIENFFYLPNTNFGGPDSFRWNAFEGTFLASQDATVSIKVTKVNDAPVLANIETESILYSLGDPAVQITKATIINDVDDNFIYSAKISIAENFSEGDLLSMEAGFSPEIDPTYNSTTGELTLTGKDTRSNYEAALTKVLFSSPVSGNATISDKRISLTVKDSLDNSNGLARIISITEVFPELDIVNSFTPNGDNVNDFWDFVNLEFYSNVNISVFDRNGRLVYNCRSKDCKWDGKVNGLELPSGTYLYTIYLNDGKRKYQGDVTILR
jgi:gliding motility-associated-like protein